MARPLEGTSPSQLFLEPQTLRDSHASGSFFVGEEPGETLFPSDANIIVLPGAVEHFEDLSISEVNSPVPTMVHQPMFAHIGGAKVRFTAEEPAMQEDRKNDTAVVIAHGIVGEEIVYEDLRHALATRGYRVISYEPARSAGLRGYHPQHLLHPEKLLGQAAYGVILEAQESLGYERFTIAGHSMGGLTIKTLLEHLGDTAPEMLDALLYIDAVGFNTESLVKRARRFVAMLALQAPPYAVQAMHKSPCRAAKIAASEVRYFARKPSRFIGELLAAQGCQNAESVLRARTLNIRTGGIALTRSGIFPPDAVARESADLFDIFRMYRGNHLAPQNDPEGMAELLDDMLAESSQPFAGIA